VSPTISQKNRKRNSRKTRERNRRILNERKRRVLKRIENRPGPERDEPMMTASNIHYELADRVQGLRVYPQRIPGFFPALRNSSIFELNCIWRWR
jgi:hypothetical protein